MIVALDGFITDFVITPANIDDHDGLCNLLDSLYEIILIGKKGYYRN